MNREWITGTGKNWKQFCFYIVQLNVDKVGPGLTRNHLPPPAPSGLRKCLLPRICVISWYSISYRFFPYNPNIGMHLDKETLWTLVSFFTEFNVILTHPYIFLEAVECPKSDGFPSFYVQPIGNSFPEMCLQCGEEALQIWLSSGISTYLKDLNV